ncbi:MAG TPA: hypothetical protein VIP78_13095 [Candidatus Dormibacteraeota bacterium]
MTSSFPPPKERLGGSPSTWPRADYTDRYIAMTMRYEGAAKATFRLRWERGQG